jgi:hypothetical protein
MRMTRGRKKILPNLVPSHFAYYKSHTDYPSGIPRNFVGGRCSANSVENRENGDLGTVAA